MENVHTCKCIEEYVQHMDKYEAKKETYEEKHSLLEAFIFGQFREEAESEESL